MTYLFTLCFSEIYAIQVGQSLLAHRVSPSCHCAREAIDSFNLIASIQLQWTVGDSRCYDAFAPISAVAEYRYVGKVQSKWAMFNDDGWMSDFTDEAEIVISTSQPMLVCNTIMLCW